MLKNLDKLLRIRGMNQTQLAEASGLSTGMISQMKNGRRGFSPDSLSKLANALHVPDHVLMMDSVPPNLLPGFMENEARAFAPDAGSNGLKALLATLAPDASHPVIYVASKTVTALGIIAGDRLVVDLNETALAGEIVIARRVDPADGTAVTLIRRWIPPFLISFDPEDTDAAMRPETDGENTTWCNIVGPVVATFRQHRRHPETDTDDAATQTGG